jgi:amino acid transporter
MQNALTELERLTITNTARNLLEETAKWCKFLAILGFIGLGLLLLSSFYISSIYSKMPQAVTMPFNFGIIMTIGYLFVVVLHIFPIYYLYQFSVKMKKALDSKNDDTLASGFEMLKSHYKFAGVFTIIVLSIYVLFAIVSVIGGLGTW